MPMLANYVTGTAEGTGECVLPVRVWRDGRKLYDLRRDEISTGREDIDLTNSPA